MLQQTVEQSELHLESYRKQNLNQVLICVNSKYALLGTNPSQLKNVRTFRALPGFNGDEYGGKNFSVVLFVATNRLTSLLR